jgi:hypothetical protein
MITELHPLIQAAILAGGALVFGYFIGKILVALDNKN